MVDHTRYTDTEVVWETPSHFYVGIYSNDNGSIGLKFLKPLTFEYKKAFHAEGFVISVAEDQFS